MATDDTESGRRSVGGRPWRIRYEGDVLSTDTTSMGVQTNDGRQ